VPIMPWSCRIRSRHASECPRWCVFQRIDSDQGLLPAARNEQDACMRDAPFKASGVFVFFLNIDIWTGRILNTTLRIVVLKVELQGRTEPGTTRHDTVR